MEKVKIELLRSKVFHRTERLQRGTVHEAYLDEKGYARLHKYPLVICSPGEYQLIITEQDYDSLLTS